MAQLIKLKDYISRYEWNSQRYASEYIRLKQRKWREVQQSLPGDYVTSTESDFQGEFLKDQTGVSDQSITIQTSEEKLKQKFLDQMFPLQLKWATSTIANLSIWDEKYKYDQTLKYFLQRFPDIYFLMYEPIFNVRNATVDGELILINPFGIDIIHLLEKQPDAKFIAGDHRTWFIEEDNEKKTIISPLITLNRTEHIVKGILRSEEIDFPVNKLVMSRTNDIVFLSEPYGTNIIGKFQYEEWFNHKRQLTSMLKHNQLGVIDALLKYCLTISSRRLEWEE